ncbi:MAG: molybdopterin-guanine dinucleotide biosynthesis protein A [Candidatus Azotimanducaceae bacterium]|jgi:molybdopterin-guanine dinucleotide biosynthesis protein A
MSTGSKITGLILSGGKGTRMNGQDKGLVLFRRRPLISHVIDRIKPQVHHLLINCNRSHDQYRALGCPIITDTGTDTDTQSKNDFQGPLQGILSMATQFREQTPALEQNEYCMIVPCDMPFLPTDLVDRLQHAIKGHAAAYASTASQVQPLVLLLRPQLLKTIPGYLSLGGRSVMGWLQNVDAITVSFTPDGFTHTRALENNRGIKSGFIHNGGEDTLSLEDALHRDAFSNINDMTSLHSFERGFEKTSK